MNYHHLSPAVQDNPYPYYAELRDKAPVAWIESMHAWAVSRYADVDFILRNSRLFSSASWKIASSGNPDIMQKVPSLLSMDPPDHVGFGYGIHYCLGAPLARLEGRMALEALLFACPPFTRVREHVPRIAT
jgi:cytochrome P450